MNLDKKTKKEDDEQIPVAQKIVATDIEAEAVSLIASAGIVDEEEWEKRFLDLKSRGNYFDLVRNLHPFKLPQACQMLQDNKERRYGFFDKESMGIKCDPSRMIYWTPVNATNHHMLPKQTFDRHGGVCREGMYLCYMPWKMYEARNSILEQANKAKYDLEEDPLVAKAADGVAHYKPEPGPGGAKVYQQPTIEHAGRVEEGIPLNESFSEAGEYEG